MRNFTCFSRLPPELQTIIWKLATPPPRVFQIQIDNSGRATVKPSCFGTYQIPSIAHVNRASREVALSSKNPIYWKGAFGPLPSLQSDLDREYWRPELDTVYIPRFLPPTPGNTPKGWPRSQAYLWYDGASEADVHTDDYNFPTTDEFGNASIQQCLSQIGNVRHLAIPFDVETRGAFLQGTPHGLTQTGAGGIMDWVTQFIHLSSLTFIVHPELEWWIYDPREMDLLPASDEDISAELQVDCTTAMVETTIIHIFEAYKASRVALANWTIPDIEIQLLDFIDKGRGFNVPDPIPLRVISKDDIEALNF